MRRALRLALLGVLLVLALACGVAVSGRVEVGEHVGEPRPASPCPQAEP